MNRNTKAEQTQVSPADAKRLVSGSARLQIVSRQLGLSGKDITFIDELFFGLIVGEKVIRIGNGKENGSIRTDDFNYPIEYVGSILCEFEKREKMFAFKLQKKTKDNQDVFLLYGSTGQEIFTEAVLSKEDRITSKTTGYVRFYDPVFVRADR